MKPEGMKSREARKAFAEVKSQVCDIRNDKGKITGKVQFKSGTDRLEAIRKAWCKACNEPYVRRQPPLGAFIDAVDTADPANAETAERDEAEDATARGRGVGRARRG